MPSLKNLLHDSLCPHFKGNSKLATLVLHQHKNNTNAGTNKNDEVLLATPILHPATKDANAGTNKHDDAKHPVPLAANKGAPLLRSADKLLTVACNPNHRMSGGAAKYATPNLPVQGGNGNDE